MACKCREPIDASRAASMNVTRLTNKVRGVTFIVGWERWCRV